MKRTLLLVLMILCSLTLLFAQDYVFDRFHLEMEAGLDNSYAVKEQIVANFSTARHGIYREIPIRFGKVRVKLKNLQSNEPIQEDSVSSDWVTFRLGSENRTVTGLYEYLISYTYVIGDDRNQEYDEFYYNLLGPGWQAPISEMSFRITFPKPVDPSMVFLTGGSYGSTAQRGIFTLSSDRRTIEGKASNLLPGEALTLRVQMEEGYFSAVKPFVDYTIPASIVAWLVAILAGLHATVLFRRHGREELFVPVVRFDPPEGLSPMEVGYLADGVVDNKDVTSMLFAWADQGCLTIEEQGKKEFLFTKLKEIPTSKTHEKKLFTAFFACGDGTSVTLKQLESGKFAEALMKAKIDVHAYFKGERRLNDSTAEKKRVLALLYAALVVVLNAIASTITYLSAETVPFLVIGFFSMGIGLVTASRLSATWVMSSSVKKTVKFFALVLFCIAMFGFAFMFEYAVLDHGLFYSVLMSLSMVFFPVYLAFLTIMTAKRSPYAQQKLEQIVGYKEFISKVEMDKLKMMIDSDPQLFYHVLGYAIVLGLEDVWAKKFARIAIDEPSWYVGGRPIRDALFYSALSHRLHGSVMEKAVYTQAKGGARSPIHSSFGSSGFSGGGFGGGGGGAW
ncbi:DUF2207 domain-containing protein [Sphaerochaeta globosa]|uniref:Transmembrane signal peptide protein n=1 Tax=Sphaerochaeta globosa (strain ATCC BAA-1886 / DSM 22777 / Buddy) TaxID=158189 RepID=F0RSA6_SPHGB|nr:DUF2207 domain-containing protein [Sphaerochaeta globosa]ADY14711.1 Protein of unknown function DUF2207, membrane [Sphaerochaeta globosa str. Buddy]